MNHKEIYIDQTGREWLVGSIEKPALVILPVHAKPMYPSFITDPSADFIYCQCAKCNMPIQDEVGLVGVEFCSSSWGIRIVCTKHSERASSAATNVPIFDIVNVLEPVIQEAFLMDEQKCEVCDGPVGCNDPDCLEIKKQGLLYKGENDELMAHFYRVNLDLISPLLTQCHTCSRFIRKKKKRRLCETCRFVFCSNKCKRNSNHNCVPVRLLFC